MIRARALAAVAALGLAACGDNLVADQVDATAPCDLPPEGACAGNTLRACDGDALVQTACGLATCQLDGAQHACVDACARAGVDEVGACSGDGVTRCVVDGDGRHAVQTVPCDAPLVCAQPDGEPAACVVDVCGSVGPLGRCDGDLLVRCDGGPSTTTDCAATGQVCAYDGAAAGYACVAPPGAFVVRGTVTYEDRPPLTDGALGELTPMPARSAEVALVLDAGSTVLATAHTSDDGSYTLYYDAPAGDPVHVMVTARSTVPARPLRVNRSQNAVHAFGAPSFPAAPSATQDVLVTDASAVSEAFNILDMGVHAMDVVRLQLGGTPMQLNARWSRGSNNGTYYANGGIFLLGASSDDDGYDDTVILHEIGHFVEDMYGRTDSPGGAHDGSPTDPTLAWSEGCSTYFAMAVRDEPYYMDSNAGGGWGYDGDASVTALAAGATLASDVSEDTVTEILWDLGDGGATDDDPLAGGTHTPVLRTWPDYLRVAPLRNVGVAGVDLVDFLDGWFVETGLSSCAGVREIVNDVRAFPYDYGGPAGACP